MQNFLITGSKGLLGHKVCENLVKNGKTVYALTTNSKNLKIDKVIYKNFDFSKNWTTKDLPNNLDVIIHLAQSNKFRNFPDDTFEVFKVNIESTLLLLNYAKDIGVKKFIYASSGGIYGNGPHPFKETDEISTPEKLGTYLGGKAYCEALVNSFNGIFQTIILRPFFVYGSGQNRDMLIPRIFDNIQKQKPIKIDGEEGIFLNPIHVNDASEAILASLKTHENSTFNIGGPDILSIKKISEAMGLYIGKTPIFNKTNNFPSNLVGDISKMISNLYKPKLSLLKSFDIVNDDKI